MGIYKHPKSRFWWFRFKGPDGKVVRRASTFTHVQEKAAQAAFAELVEKLKAGAAVADVDLGVPTVRSYSAKWLKEREARKLQTASDDRQRMKDWILPVLGAVPLAELRPRQVQDFVRGLKSRKTQFGRAPAPRTIRQIWGLLRTMLHDAVADEFIPASPAVLKRGDLPPMADADPEWRETAVFTRDEVERLISDPRIPEERRVRYAVHFLTGSRAGEAVALKWSGYQLDAKPLRRLVFAQSWDRRYYKLKQTKTGVVRKVPVHPTLAKMLDRWRSSGWEKLVGRAPGPDDFILPRADGLQRNVGAGLVYFHADLKLLGLRRRRQHDARRTFISLALDAGARRDVVEWITHTPGGIVNAYTTLAWGTLCEAVECVPVVERPNLGTPEGTPVLTVVPGGR